MTYLITFACYGCHLHGDEKGSVDRKHNLTGSRLIAADPKRVAVELLRMVQPAYSMDESRRKVVLEGLTERCVERGWALLAAHVRTNHVHVVVEAEDLPERIMNDLKAYASRRLNQLGFDEPDRKRWARHGSTRWLSTRDAVSAAIQYVVDKQGEPMAVYVA
jgi:REP element-mobilizing transposase RayT